MYKFRFSAWDKLETPNGRYNETTNDIAIIIVADNEADATTQAKALAGDRAVLALQSIVAMASKDTSED